MTNYFKNYSAFTADSIANIIKKRFPDAIVSVSIAANTLKVSSKLKNIHHERSISVFAFDADFTIVDFVESFLKELREKVELNAKKETHQSVFGHKVSGQLKEPFLIAADLFLKNIDVVVYHFPDAVIATQKGPLGSVEIHFYPHGKDKPRAVFIEPFSNLSTPQKAIDFMKHMMEVTTVTKPITAEEDCGATLNGARALIQESVGVTVGNPAGVQKVQLDTSPKPTNKQQTLGYKYMRELTSHKVNPCNDTLQVHCVDLPGAGGACHNYVIGGMNAPDYQYCVINFQNGPIKEAGVNGVTHEALLAILVDRIEHFQRGPYACPENAQALVKLQEAQMWLQKRTRDRMARGVEGTHVK